MSSYLKQAWETQVSLGKKIKVIPAEHEKISSITGALRNYKSRSAASFKKFGMIELAAQLEAQTIRFEIEDDGVLIWMESKTKPNQGTFIVIEEEDEE